MEERVKKVLNEINEEICKYQGNQLWEDGIIDSFDVMGIVAGLEEEFGIEVDAEYVIVENFSNADSVMVLMASLLERGRL